MCLSDVLDSGSLGILSLLATQARDSHAIGRPNTDMAGSTPPLISPTGNLLGEVGNYDDELTAYLHFEYVRSLKAVDSWKVLLTTGELQSGTVYRVYLELDNDLLTAIPYFG